jgi:hypothetical protein
VAEYLVELKSGRVTRPEVDEAGRVAAETVTVPGQGDWTASMVDTLAEGTPYAGVVALLDRCAAAPGTWILKSEVEGERGISAIQLRNELGALSKLTKRLFGQVIWPMQWKKEQGRYYYRMDDPIAQWWLDGRRSA